MHVLSCMRNFSVMGDTVNFPGQLQISLTALSVDLHARKLSAMLHAFTSEDFAIDVSQVEIYFELRMTVNDLDTQGEERACSFTVCTRKFCAEEVVRQPLCVHLEWRTEEIQKRSERLSDNGSLYQLEDTWEQNCMRDLYVHAQLRHLPSSMVTGPSMLIPLPGE